MVTFALALTALLVALKAAGFAISWFVAWLPLLVLGAGFMVLGIIGTIVGISKVARERTAANQTIFVHDGREQWVQ